MAKRLSDKQKDEILRKFKEGKSADVLATEFNCTKSTILRNLKKNIGEIEYKSINFKNSSPEEVLPLKEDIKRDLIISNHFKEEVNEEILSNQNQLDKKIEDNVDSEFSHFIELTPLNEDVENSTQKDLSSVPISEISLPKIVYMVVDKKTELEIKTLKDFPEWQFLSENELKRKTIQLFPDMKTAKRYCGNDQKVIKVPNTRVFEVAAPILTSRGISRIISDNQLISL